MAGCGVADFFRDKDNAEQPAPLVDFQPTLEVTEIWSKNIASGTDEQYLKLAPLIAGQRLYIVDNDGDVRAMDAGNGRKIWSRDADIKITGGPGYGENTILIGSNEGIVVSYEADSGTEMWRTAVSSEILSPPLRSQDIVIVRTIDGKIFGLNGDDGSRLWIYDRSTPPLSLRGTSAPVIVDGVLIAGFDGGKLVVLELKTGKLIWEVRIATARGRSELERMVDIDSEPLVINGVVYVATFQGNIAAVEIETARILWTREISSYAGFCADSGNLYITDDKSHIWAFDRYTGASLWKQDKLQARAATGPACIGEYIVVGDLEGYLHWISASSGEFAARTRLDNERIITAPIVVEDTLYAYDSDGSVGAYKYQ